MKYFIHIYTKFFTKTHLYIKGRVLRDGPIVNRGSYGLFSSLGLSILRAMSREVSAVSIKCKWGNLSFTTESNKEGYFEIFEPVFVNEDRSQRIHLFAEYKKSHGDKIVDLDFQDESTGLGIISDIDDTIMVSRVKSFFKLKLIFYTLFLNPFRRNPIQSAAQAYRAMSQHKHGKSPIIYVSNSPWNLYNYLQTFMRHNDFPYGVLILRDVDIRLLKKRPIVAYNKYIEIEKMITAFKNTSFTLIGDTGEKDFKIYNAIRDKYPERIHKIILNRAGNSKNIRKIKQYNINQKPHRQIKLVEGYDIFLDQI